MKGTGDDSWKGEHLIRAKITPRQGKKERQRVISEVYHKLRRRAGEPAPAMGHHRSFMATTFNNRGKK